MGWSDCPIPKISTKRNYPAAPVQALGIWYGPYPSEDKSISTSVQLFVNSQHVLNATDPNAVPSSLWKDWLLVLFKLLWDLKATDEALSHAILCSLLTCLRHRRKQLVICADEEEVLQSGEATIADRIESLQKAFIPFFCQRTTSRKRRQSAPAKLGVQQHVLACSCAFVSPAGEGGATL